MIRINLLPEEYRRKARTPIKQMATVAIVVAVNASLLAFWGWMTFGLAAEIETERSVLQLEMDGLTPQVNYHTSLETETKAYASRESTLAEITKNRILWTEKLDEIIDLVNLGADGVRHYIWFDDLTVKQEQSIRSSSFGSFKASGHSGSPKWDQVANFLEDVEDKSISGFIDTFFPPASPEGTQNPREDDLIPSEVWSFPLSLNIKSPDDRLKIAEAEASEMKERKFMFCAIGGGVLAAAGIVGLIKMQSDEIDAARASITQLNTDIDTARKTIEGTGSLEREVIVLRELAEVIQAILPNAEDVNNLIRTFHDYSGESGMRTTSYKRKDTSRSRNNTAFDKVSYTFALEGDVYQFLDLVDRIETHSRLIAIPSFKINSASRRSIEEEGVANHKVQLDIETYQYEPKATAKQVRIEGYDRKRDLLAGEINRRKQALTLASYTYRGPRGRRDPWVDPRVPANARDASAYSVPEQMELVERLSNTMAGAEVQYQAVEVADNVLAAMVARRDLEKTLTTLEEELRRLSQEGAITYVPAQKRLTNDVYGPLDKLRNKLTRSQGLIGPSKEMLLEVQDVMTRNIDGGEFLLALDAFTTVENGLDLLTGDPVRIAVAEELRELAWEARTLRDFSQVELNITGVAIMEGAQSAVVINGRTLSIGDMVTEELEITDILPNEIEFYFRGLILGRDI